MDCSRFTTLVLLGGLFALVTVGMGCPEPPFADCDLDGIEDDVDDCLTCDRDQDGFVECDEDGQLVDCNDSDEDVYPGADETVCDGKDTDCDPSTPDAPDADGDGFHVCDGEDDGGDCDDGDADVYPGATEACDGADTDCDGALAADELDADGDGFMVCEEDCDDGDAATHPGADELCDGLDNDCDGSAGADEVDEDVDGFLACEDCDDADPASYPGAEELCDGLDNDCDGAQSPDETDADGDGVAECEGDCDDDEVGSSPGAPELCDGADNDCDPATDENADADSDGYSPCDGDCDDADPDRNPGEVEACDGLDNDCDGVVPADEADADADGQRECEGDCDDGDPTVYLWAPELCDGLDNDCDYVVDEGTDEDGDGDGETACSGDCNDDEIDIYPGAPELCDGLDNDCDGILLAGEEDLDGDGWHVCEGDCDDSDVRTNPAATDVDGGPDHDCNGVADDTVVCDLWVPVEYATIQDALDATGGYETICVEPGTYVENIDFLGKPVHLLGVAGARATIIDGGGTGPVVLMSSGEPSNAVIEGFTITGGYGGGAAIYAYNSSPTLRRLVVSGNDSSAYHANIVSVGDDAVLEWIRVVDNLGVGISVASGGVVTIRQSVVARNGRYGIEINGDAVIEYTWVADHQEDNAAGIYVKSGTTTLEYVVVADIDNTDQSMDGGGIVVDDDDLVATHCVVFGNTGGSYNLGDGGGILVEATADLRDLILANNMPYGIQGSNDSVTVAYSDFDGNWADPVEGMSDPIGFDGNISVFPGFAEVDLPNPLLWDFHLAAASLVVGMGDPALPDPDGGPGDMGIYGGPGAGGWDLDDDGYFEWWLPGPYDPATSPGMDCDDRNPGIYPGQGC